LFPGYLFVRVNVMSGEKLEVLKTPGVAGFIGNASGPIPIPASQIESIRKILAVSSDCSSQPLLSEGDHVRVIAGPLAGIEGILLRTSAKSQLIVCIKTIQRSISVTVLDSDVEPAICTQQRWASVA
jgi:transcription antitermination factor NusG